MKNHKSQRKFNFNYIFLFCSRKSIWMAIIQYHVFIATKHTVLEDNWKGKHVTNSHFQHSLAFSSLKNFYTFFYSYKLKIFNGRVIYWLLISSNGQIMQFEVASLVSPLDIMEFFLHWFIANKVKNFSENFIIIHLAGRGIRKKTLNNLGKN